jgi:uncharacterized protein (DUF1330 family)
MREMVVALPDRPERAVAIAHPAAGVPIIRPAIVLILQREIKMNEELGRGGDIGSTSQPPVAYVISAVEGFMDEVTVRRFAELAGPAIEHFGGRFIVSNTEPVVVEGESASGHLSMVEFPSIEHAKAWYDSPEYAEARALTPATFRGRVLMFVEGVKA